MKKPRCAGLFCYLPAGEPGPEGQKKSVANRYFTPQLQLKIVQLNLPRYQGH